MLVLECLAKRKRKEVALCCFMALGIAKRSIVRSLVCLHSSCWNLEEGQKGEKTTCFSIRSYRSGRASYFFLVIDRYVSIGFTRKGLIEIHQCSAKGHNVTELSKTCNKDQVLHSMKTICYNFLERIKALQ